MPDRAPADPDETASAERLGEGRRERKKREKLARITAAAKELFREKGYESATTREIATRAQVGIGTVFLYAPTKVDLLRLVFAEEIARLEHLAFSTLPEGDVVDRLAHVFGTFVDFYATDPELARRFIKELSFADPATEAVRRDTDSTFVARLVGLLAEHQQRGEIRGDADLLTAGGAVFGLYLFSLFLWLSGTLPDVPTQRVHLRATLALFARGLCEPRDAAP